MRQDFEKKTQTPESLDKFNFQMAGKSGIDYSRFFVITKKKKK